MTILFGEYELLAKSELFDANFYVRANPDVANLNIDPLMHYLERGCHERRNPSANFDTSYYLTQCESLGETPTNALIHYLTIGAKRGLMPRPGLDVRPGKATRHAKRARSAEAKAGPASNKDALHRPLSKKSSTGPTNGSAGVIPRVRVAPKATESAAGSTATQAPFPGYVDIFGYSSAAGGWLFSGWVARPSRTDQAELVEFIGQFEQTQSKGRATLAFYQREDLDQKSIGVIAFLPSSSRAVGNLRHVVFTLDGIEYTALCASSAARLPEQELIDHVRPNLLNLAFANRNRSHLLSITSRRGFTGQDTLSALSETVLLEIDEAILCPPDGVLLRGWQLSVAGAIRSIRVRSGPLAGELRLSKSIRIARQDVIDSVAHTGFSDLRCGFIAYVAGAISDGDTPYLEVELASGEVGFKHLKLSKRSGIDAMRQILEGIDVRYGEIDPAFDNVLGPAISSLNAARLQGLPPVQPLEMQFGQAPDNPRFSLIVPLYARVDFIEFQMAMFSRHRSVASVDIIYVLDDPHKLRELELLAESVFERFRIPFRLLLLPRNLGFGPASNVGLRAAHGQYICFLNSDVLPITLDWLERLVDRLVQNSDLGIVGGQLLYEDGSIQHEGCFYRTLPEFGNWTFIDHLNKGRRRSSALGLQRCSAITGACMVMERGLAMQLNGFDEAFIVGDFEDSDLCLRVNERGLSCAVDLDVQLYHLERKSQAGPGQSWRMNLTLYNAWVHQRRWFDAMSSGQTPARNYP